MTKLNRQYYTITITVVLTTRQDLMHSSQQFYHTQIFMMQTMSHVNLISHMKATLFPCLYITSVSSRYLCSCRSMHMQSAEHKGCSHGKSTVFMLCHYQSASEMRFRLSKLDFCREILTKYGLYIYIQSHSIMYYVCIYIYIFKTEK